MAIYELTDDALVPLTPGSFAEVSIGERSDLQRILRDHVEFISPDTMVIAEEYGQWQESRRRIDLLGLDKDANLVIIELKRSEGGGHMDLQAIRYAAMVSALSFDDVVAAHSDYLASRNISADARRKILDFLDWEEPEDGEIGEDVRIVLASADFSKELTTVAIWLNNRNLDIRCIRMKPYVDGDRLLLDVQQLVPLPEAAEYQIQIRDKNQKGKPPSHTDQCFDLRLGDRELKGVPRAEAFYQVFRYLCDSGFAPEEIARVITWRKVYVDVDNELNAQEFAVKCQHSRSRVNPQHLFCSDEELIHHMGRTYAVYSKWGSRLPAALNKIVEAFGYKSISFTIRSLDSE